MEVIFRAQCICVEMKDVRVRPGTWLEDSHLWRKLPLQSSTVRKMPALSVASPRVRTQGGKWGNEPNDVSCEGGEAKTVPPLASSCKHSCVSRGHGASFLCTESVQDTAIPAQSVGKMSWGTLDRIPNIGTRPLWHTNKTNTSFQGESTKVYIALCCLKFRVGSPSPRTFSEKGWNYVLCPWSPRSFPLLRNQSCQEGGSGGGKSVRQGGAGGRKERRRINENKFCWKMLSGNLIFCMTIFFLISLDQGKTVFTVSRTVMSYWR